MGDWDGLGLAHASSLVGGSLPFLKDTATQSIFWWPGSYSLPIPSGLCPEPGLSTPLTLTLSFHQL